MDERDKRLDTDQEQIMMDMASKLVDSVDAPGLIKGVVVIVDMLDGDGEETLFTANTTMTLWQQLGMVEFRASYLRNLIQ